MYIKPSAQIQNNYKEVAELCKTTGEPIYLTNNGEGELVVMSIESYERHMLQTKTGQDLMCLELEKAKGLATYTSIQNFDLELDEIIISAEKSSPVVGGHNIFPQFHS